MESFSVLEPEAEGFLDDQKTAFTVPAEAMLVDELATPGAGLEAQEPGAPLLRSAMPRRAPRAPIGRGAAPQLVRHALAGGPGQHAQSRGDAT